MAIHECREGLGMSCIDLNGDVGESFGVYTVGNDRELMNYVTSVNIACGAHAGDANVMDKTVFMAKENNLAIGAHPGFPDLSGFGRRMMSFQPEEIYRMVVWQIAGLKGFCDIHNVTLHHVKPHGALYNLAAKDEAVAQAISEAVVDVDASLILYGLANSLLPQVATKNGLTSVQEVFADRTYQSDGTLTPRTEPNALIDNASSMRKHVERMIRFGEVETITGDIIPIKADTICIHGDNKQALILAENVCHFLHETGIDMHPIQKG